PLQTVIWSLCLPYTQTDGPTALRHDFSTKDIRYDRNAGHLFGCPAGILNTRCPSVYVNGSAGAKAQPFMRRAGVTPMELSEQLVDAEWVGENRRLFGETRLASHVGHPVSFAIVWAGPAGECPEPVKREIRMNE